MTVTAAVSKDIEEQIIETAKKLGWLKDERNINRSTMEVRGKQLRRRGKKSSKKAAGPDHWMAKHLDLLPDEWWDLFAKLWNIILSDGTVPMEWCMARVVLIAKANGGKRPLSLATVLWRIGAGVINSDLVQWAAGWASRGGRLPMLTSYFARLSEKQKGKGELHSVKTSRLPSTAPPSFKRRRL